MKSSLFSLSVISAVFLLLFSIVNSCDTPTAEHLNQPEIMELSFTRSSYPAGQPLILRAKPNPELQPDFFQEETLRVQLSVGDEHETSGQLSPWSAISDEEMVAAIKDGPGRVAVRIKEADRKSARTEEGELVRSEEAMNKFIDWVENHPKLSIAWVAKLHPDIGIDFVEEPTAELVHQVRHHENVEFMEPIQYGEYLSVTSPKETESLKEDLVTVIGLGEYNVQPGESITAAFKREDGSTLTATTSIVQ